ncbi:MAG: PfkB family carbohydrate kinase [Calditrichia bacterium]
MKITVIGTINKDIVLPYNQLSFQSLGGITYTLATLRNFVSSEDQIIPVSYIGHDVVDLMEGLRQSWPTVNFDALIRLEQKNHQVILEYDSPTERKEKALFFFPQLEWEQIQPWLDTDFVIVNMITGKELSLDTYKKIADQIYQRLYIDIHFLVMDVDSLGNRIEKRPDDIYDWLNYSRFIQMNEHEYEIINREGIAMDVFWKGLLRPSQHVFLTRGEKGVLWISYEDEFRMEQIEAYNIPMVNETTGCGDVFGASFSYAYLYTKNIRKALEFAVCAASASTQISGTENFYQLKDKMVLLNKKLVDGILQ